MIANFPSVPNMLCSCSYSLSYVCHPLCVRPEEEGAALCVSPKSSLANKRSCSPGLGGWGFRTMLRSAIRCLEAKSAAHSQRSQGSTLSHNLCHRLDHWSQTGLRKGSTQTYAAS